MLVLRSGALGDFVLTLPVLEALRSSLPRARICYVGRGEFGALARMGSLADEVIPEDRPEVVALFSDSPGVPAGPGRSRTCRPGAADGIRKGLGRVDLAVSFISSDVLTRNLLAAGAGEVLSCRPRPPFDVLRTAALSLSKVRPPAGGEGHASDHLVSVLRGRIEVPARAVPRLRVPGDLRERARKLLRERGLEAGRFLALHPGSGSPRKSWPAARFAGLARLARRELGLGIAVLLGPAEEEGAKGFLDAFEPVADACFDRPPLESLAGLLSGCAAYVGNDSGVTHLAAAVGAPTVAVFGPTDPAVWGPRGGNARVVRDRSGKLGSVRVDQALEALREALGEG